MDFNGKPIINYSDVVDRNRLLALENTDVGISASASEQDLHTYTLPANTLDSDKKSIRIKAFGRTGGTVGAIVYFRLYINGTLIAQLFNTNTNRNMYLEYIISRREAASQLSCGAVYSISAPEANPTFTFLTKDETTALIIKTTGEDSGGNANGVISKFFSVELLQAP